MDFHQSCATDAYWGEGSTDASNLGSELRRSKVKVLASREYMRRG